MSSGISVRFRQNPVTPTFVVVSHLVVNIFINSIFYKVDKAVYRHLRDVYSYPEASPGVKAAMGERPTP